jgi:SagB-type dehydrogenase family enzyme
VLVPTDSGILLDGGRHAEMLTGPLAVSLLPVLLPYLDGLHTLADIKASLPHIPASALEQLVQQLLGWTVLSLDGPPVSRSTCVQNTLSAMKRYDIEFDLLAAESLLARRKILLLFETSFDELAGDVMRTLRQNGWKWTDVKPIGSFLVSETSEESFIVYLSGDGEGIKTAANYSRLSASTRPWLRTVMNTELGFAEIGPHFLPGSILCKKCLARPLEGPRPNVELRSHNREIWAALLATEVTAQLLENSPLGSHSVRRYRLPSLESDLRTWPVAILCPYGHTEEDIPTGVESPEHYVLPFLYEQAIARRQESADAIMRQPVSKVGSSNRLLNCAIIKLPEVKTALPQNVLTLLTQRHKCQKVPLNLEQVATLLKFSFGIKQQTRELMRRWAPSAGNLGSAEAYVAVRDVDGLQSGVYFYSPEDHALARLNHRGTNHLEAVFAAVQGDKLASMFLIMVGAYRRVARKYHSFAYKLVYLDAGSMSSQVLTVAKALGLNMTGVPSWNTRSLEEAVSLRLSQEIPTQVFRFGESENINLQKLDRDESVRNPATAGFEQVSSWHTDKIVDYMIIAEDSVKGRFPPSIECRGRWNDKWQFSWLARVREGRNLSKVLDGRQSIRTFSDKAVESTIICLILKAAFFDNVCREIPLRVSVLVRQANGLAPGVYSYHPESRVLTRKHGMLSFEHMRGAFLNSNYERTPVTFWISGDVRGSVWSRETSYQTLLLRAGYLGHRLSMAAMEFDLSGSLVAGIGSEAASKKEEWLDSRETSLLAYICGFSAT